MFVYNDSVIFTAIEKNQFDVRVSWKRFDVKQYLTFSLLFMHDKVSTNADVNFSRRLLWCQSKVFNNCTHFFDTDRWHKCHFFLVSPFSI